MLVGGGKQHKNEEGCGRSYPCVSPLLLIHACVLLRRRFPNNLFSKAFLTFPRYFLLFLLYAVLSRFPYILFVQQIGVVFPILPWLFTLLFSAPVLTIDSGRSVNAPVQDSMLHKRTAHIPCILQILGLVSFRMVRGTSKKHTAFMWIFKDKMQPIKIKKNIFKSYYIIYQMFNLSV